MVVDSNKLWKKALTVANKVGSNVRTLAKVSSPEDGREFISDLELETESCRIEIQGYVCSNPPFPLPPLTIPTVVHQRNGSGSGGA
jgi:hypothetical protein